MDTSNWLTKYSLNNAKLEWILVNQVNDGEILPQMCETAKENYTHSDHSKTVTVKKYFWQKQQFCVEIWEAEVNVSQQ